MCPITHAFAKRLISVTATAHCSQLILQLMAESHRKQSSVILSLLGEEVTVEKLRRACVTVMSQRKKVALECRHGASCYRRGSPDKGKAPCIRRDLLLDALKIRSSLSKAHLRAYHIAFFSCASDEDISELQSRPSELEIRHLCGHGDCDNPAHLKLGSVLQNEEDKHFHHVLDKANDPAAVLALLRQQIPSLDVL